MIFFAINYFPSGIGQTYGFSYHADCRNKFVKSGCAFPFL